MKNKILLLLICIFGLPITTMAYSKYIIPGGETIGINIKSDGVLVVGFYKINNKYNKSSLKVGDYITTIMDEPVNSLNDLTSLVERYKDESEIKVGFRRNKKELTGTIKLIYDNNVYKTGLYVKDGLTGCGTLSYIDPNTKIFGALGHEIIESNTNNIIEIKTGEIFENRITSITKSYDGTPGSKNSRFNYNNIYGDINRNTKVGIYGIYTDELPNKDNLKVASKEEIKIGEAYITTVLNDKEVKNYKINITNINDDSDTKNITFEIIDNNLLDKTGGIVQGMSGSPIIQNDMIIGAVTHVKVDNVKSGYGIFITRMLEEGEKKGIDL